MPTSKSPFVGHRKLKGRIQTRVLDLRSEHFDRRITLIGAVHSAPPAYYERMLGIITDRINAGYTVHHEGLLPADDEGAMNLLPRQRLAMERSCDAHTDVTNLLTALGVAWIRQRDALPYDDDGWHDIDVRLVDVVRLSGPEPFLSTPILAGVGPVNGPDALAKVAAMPLRMRKLVVWSAMKVANNVAKLDKSRIGRSRRADVAVETHWRNVVATRAALDTKGDVVMIWGAKHIEGIGTMLGRNGFEPIGDEWLTPLPSA